MCGQRLMCIKVSQKGLAEQPTGFYYIVAFGRGQRLVRTGQLTHAGPRAAVASALSLVLIVT
jgi:hypothetical protein